MMWKFQLQDSDDSDDNVPLAQLNKMQLNQSQQFHCNKHCENANNLVNCHLCVNKTFKTEIALQKHTKEFHFSERNSQIKQYICDYCGKSLSTYRRMVEHIRLHTGEKPITLCDTTFMRQYNLSQHLNLHNQRWKCNHCQKCFSTTYKLKEHYRLHTGELPYECDKCERKFAKSTDFKYHIGTKPYSCKDCGAKYTSTGGVTRHRLDTHTVGPKLYQCSQCPKSFFTETRLKTHSKYHEPKIKYKCNLCPAVRRSLVELNKHAVIHGGEFRCDTCHRGFESAARLATHASRHDIAGKPYACFVCSVGYGSSRGLSKHLSTVHRNEDITKIAPQHLCTLCGQVFKLKDKLNRHLKENHIVIAIGEILPLDANKEIQDNKNNS